MQFKSFILICLLTLVGCNNSSSDNEPSIPIEQPSTDLVTVGTISGFGSIISNGVTFSTTAATVMIDTEPSNLAELQVGMVVSIRGSVNTNTGAATASYIHFESDVEGVITNINTNNNSLIILGRTILVDELTVINNASFATLAIGNIVKVSGQWRDQERIQATYITRTQNQYMNGMHMQVKGVIQALDPDLQRFNIGTQVCDYSGAMLKLNGSALTNGMYVEASSMRALSENVFFLDQLQIRERNRNRYNDGDKLCNLNCDFELSGFITEFISATDFTVDSLPVTTTSSTVFVNGSSSSLGLDVKVKVDGVLNDDDILVADKIVFSLQSVIEIDADVESINVSNAELSILGINVEKNSSTLLHDHSDAALREFSINDLAFGDRVNIRAYMDGDSVMVSRLERQSPEDKVTLKALVEEINPSSLTLLGVNVTTNQNTIYRNKAREIIDAETFFLSVTTTSLVKAEGSYDNTAILANKLYLLDCDNGCL